MIGQKDSVMVWDERGEASCHLFSSGCGVCCQWDYPKSHRRLLTQHLVQPSSDTSECRRDRRMRMNDCCNIVSMSIDCEMHTDLARHLPVSIEMSSLKIDDDHVGRCQQELADTGGSDQQTRVVQPNGKIARRPRHKPQTIEHSA